ncbi:hypothetical protein MIND_00575100 [Mycena indigotica]|uniref:Uncharacterized protein n=1 Tax=Mycena indigotica TaxID=2126181 RepID=A0A8H6SPI2_9AGAR|nr:uncharacterized protein MIND_00575100 [Mycena indigotica]KAF7303463.1 hypothetical protein MIND_00575100 [Mycena indigotica]
MFLAEWWLRLTYPPVAGAPRLPEDLEREIFIRAALADTRGTHIPRLLRVAKRVHSWLEPYLYRVLLLLDYTDNAKFIADRLTSKPPHIWRDGPRHLFLALGDDSPNVTVMRELLSACPRLEDINFYPPDDQPGVFLPALRGMEELRQLSTELAALFDRTRGISSIDLTGPGFAALTHLMLFDDLPFVTEFEATHLSTQLALLPALTHLALVGTIQKHLVIAILTTCDATLRVLVNRRPDLRRHTVQTMYERELSGVTDVRLVIMPFGVWVGEWEDAARGVKDDFWVEAEQFVAQKRQKQIDADTFWTDENMTV